jgi:hypothetical protein
MCVICLLCLIVLPLPPGKTPFAVKINNNSNNKIIIISLNARLGIAGCRVQFALTRRISLRMFVLILTPFEGQER